MPHIDKPYHHHTIYGDWIARGVSLTWLPATKVLGPFCSFLVEWADKQWLRFMFALVVLTLATVGWDIALYYDDPGKLEWLWITGYPIGLFVLFRSSGLPDRIYYLRQSLVNQGILDVYDPLVSPEPSLARERRIEHLDSASAHFLKHLKDRVLRHTAVLTILISLFANYVVHQVGLYRVVPDDAGLVFTLNAFANHALGHFYVLLVSLRLGRIVAFGILMWAHGLVRLCLPGAEDQEQYYRVRLNPQPGHPDGLCGLKTILDFWTFEASLLVPPLIYTLTWLAISSSGYCLAAFWDLCGGEGATGLHSKAPANVFFWLTLILIVMQLLSLWTPLLALRMQMGHAKNVVKARLDEIVRQTAQLRYDLAHSNEAGIRKESAERLAHALDAYQDYQNMPLWPVSNATLKAHVVQLWTVLVFLGVLQEDVKIWPLVKGTLGMT